MELGKGQWLASPHCQLEKQGGASQEECSLKWYRQGASGFEQALTLPTISHSLQIWH